MDAKLIRLTEERIDNNTALSTFVEKAKALTIPLFPETVQFTDSALKFGAAVVSVNLTLDQYGNNRDIYKNESGGYCLHLSKLNEIAQQAGIQIIDSRIIERKVDEQGRVTFIEHHVKGKMKSVDGSIKEATITGKYDYFRDREKYVKKTGEVLENMIKARRTHAEALAESNALSRLYNKLIAQIPTSFTLDELKKPFLIPYVIEDKDELLKDLPKEEQIAIKKELVRKRLGIADAIYAPPTSASLAIVQKPTAEDASYKVVDDEPQTQPTGESEEVRKAKNKILASEFKDSPQSERTQKILKLIDEKKWVHPQGVKVTAAMIEKAPLEKQIERIEELLNYDEPVPEASL